MERRLHADLSDVRVHDDARSAHSAESLGARAFTVGQHIFFGRDGYEPESGRGQALLAHELAHTIQQRNVSGSLENADLDTDEARENDAQAATRAVATSTSGDSHGSAVRERCSSPVIQRDEYEVGSGTTLTTRAGESVSGVMSVHDQALPPHVGEMFAEMMNRVRRLETAATGEAMRGFDVISVVRVEDSGGAPLVEMTGNHQVVHAEVDAIRGARRRMSSMGVAPEQAAGGRLYVMVSKEPCAACAAEIGSLAEELGIAAENIEVYYVTRESMLSPGVAVAGRQSLRTRLRSPVAIGRLNVFVIAFSLYSELGLGTSQRRAESQVREHGYSPVGAAVYAHEPWWVRVARVFTGDLLFSEMFAGIGETHQFDLPVWREQVRARLGAMAMNEEIELTWQYPECRPFSMGAIRSTRITYRRVGPIHFTTTTRYLPNGDPVPDLGRIMDAQVSDAEIESMLTSRCGDSTTA